MLKVACSFLLAAGLLLSGCASGIGTEASPTVSGVQGAQTAPGIHGIVHGGQPPVSFSSIYVYVPGTTGYGSTATILASTTTDANGNFNITGLYTCPASNPQVYISAIGGNPGLTLGSNNNALYLVAATTDCNTLKANAATEFIVINEVTTVAAAYALNKFVNTANGFIGSYGYSTTGLVNAFTTANSIVDISTGNARAVTPAGDGAVPQAEINTLANIIAPCVNSTGSSSTACTALFGDVSLSPPLNTWLAAVSIALHPGTNVSTLFSLAGATPPFQPALASASNDWTVALNFNDGGTNPQAIAVDSNGNIALANDPLVSFIDTEDTPTSLRTAILAGSAEPTALVFDSSNPNIAYIARSDGTVNPFNPNTQTFSTPITGPSSIGGEAFDVNGLLRVTDPTNGSLWDFNPGDDAYVSPGPGHTAGGFAPTGPIVANPDGDIFMANGSSVAWFNSIGIPYSSSPITVPGINTVTALANGTGNTVYVGAANGNLGQISRFGAILSGSSGISTGLSSVSALAVDGEANVIVAGQAGSNSGIAVVNSSNTLITTVPYLPLYLKNPIFVTIDPSGYAWFADGNPTTTNGITTNATEVLNLAYGAYPITYQVQKNQVGNRPGNKISIAILSGWTAYYTPNSAYIQKIVASGGNSGIFLFSATGLPPGYSIDPVHGTISGTTSATGTFTVTVTVADAGNLTNTSSKTFTLSSTIPARGNEGVLANQTFAVELEGAYNGSAPGQVYGNATLVELLFGSSGLVSGNYAYNDANSSSTVRGSLTGTDNYGTDGRGTLDLNLDNGINMQFAFVGRNKNGSGVPQDLSFIRFDDTLATTGPAGGAIGSGVGFLQNLTGFTTAQNFVFQVQGETSCTNDGGANPGCATVTPFGALTGVGVFNGNGSGLADFAGVNQSWNSIPLTVTSTPPDINGFGTINISGSGFPPAWPATWTYLVVGPGKVYVMSNNGHSNYSMLLGEADAQTTPIVLSGPFVDSFQSYEGGDGVSSFPTRSDQTLLDLLVGPSPGVLQFPSVDENKGTGAVILQQTPPNGTYSLDINYRMTSTGFPGNGRIFYFANNSLAFSINQPSSTSHGGPGVGTLEAQSGTFGCPASSPTLAAGAKLSVIPQFNVAAVIGSTYTEDLSTPAGVLTLGQVGTYVCSTDSLTGTTGGVNFGSLFGINLRAYQVAPDDFRGMYTIPYDEPFASLVIQK